MDRRIELTPMQAKVLERKHAVLQAAQNEWMEALLLAGINGKLTGGDMTADPPYLTVEAEEE